MASGHVISDWVWLAKAVIDIAADALRDFIKKNITLEDFKTKLTEKVKQGGKKIDMYKDEKEFVKNTDGEYKKLDVNLLCKIIQFLFPACEILQDVIKVKEIRDSRIVCHAHATDFEDAKFEEYKQDLERIMQRMSDINEPKKSYLERLQEIGTDLSKMNDDQLIEEYTPKLADDKLKVGHFDVLTIYHDDDRDEAAAYRDHLLSIELKGGRRVKAVLFDDSDLEPLSGSKFQHLDEAYDRCTYTFVFLTKQFCLDKDGWSRFSSESCLGRAINDKRADHIVPIFTVRKPDFKIPIEFSRCKGSKFYNNDEYYMKALKSLLESNIEKREKRERNRRNCLLIEIRKYILTERFDQQMWKKEAEFQLNKQKEQLAEESKRRQEEQEKREQEQRREAPTQGGGRHVLLPSDTSHTVGSHSQQIAVAAKLPSNGQMDQNPALSTNDSPVVHPGNQPLTISIDTNSKDSGTQSTWDMEELQDGMENLQSN